VPFSQQLLENQGTGLQNQHCKGVHTTGSDGSGAICTHKDTDNFLVTVENLFKRIPN
jgi:hypothetical protein